MKIDFSNDAMKAFGRLDSNTAGRVIKGIMGLPGKGDIKALHGYSDGRLRLRVGDYRVVFKDIVVNKEKMLYIMDIGSRGGIYE